MPSDGQPAAKRKKSVSSGNAVTFPNPSALLGRKLEVDWVGEGKFTGTVKAYHPKRKVTVPWKIVYTDGDVEYGGFDSNLDIMYVNNGQRPLRWLGERPVWSDLFKGGAEPDTGAAGLAPANRDDSKHSALSTSSSPGFPSRSHSQVSTPSHSQQQDVPPNHDGHPAARMQGSVPKSPAPAAAAGPAVPSQKVQQVVQQATANLPRPNEPAVQNPRLPSLQPVVKRSSQAPGQLNKQHSFTRTPQSNLLKRKQSDMPSQPAKPYSVAGQPLNKLTAPRKVEPAHPANRPSLGHLPSAASSAPKQPIDGKTNGARTPPHPASASLPSTASAPAAATAAAAAMGIPSAAAAAAAAIAASRGAATSSAAPVLKVTDFSQAGSKARSTAMESSTRLAKFSNSLQELQGTTSRSKIASAAEEGLNCARDMGASKVMRIILERLKSEDNTLKNFAVCFVLDNMMYKYHKEGAGADSWMAVTAKDLIAKVAACFRELMNAVVRSSDACDRLQKLFASWRKRGTFTACGYQREFEIALSKMRELQVSHRPPLKSIFVALPPLPGNTFSTTGVHYAMDDPWGSFQRPGAIPGVDLLLQEPAAQWTDDWGDPKGHHLTWPQFFKLHPELVPKPPAPAPDGPGQLTQMQQLQLEREAEAARAAGGLLALGGPGGWAGVKVEEGVKEEEEAEEEGCIDAVEVEDTWDYDGEQQTSPAEPSFAPPAPSRHSNLRSERSQPSSDQDEYDPSPNGDTITFSAHGNSMCSPMSLQASQQAAAGVPAASASISGYGPPARDLLSPAWTTGAAALQSSAAAPAPSAGVSTAPGAAALQQPAPAPTAAHTAADSAPAAWAPYQPFDVLTDIPSILDSLSHHLNPAVQQQQQQQAATHQLPTDTWPASSQQFSVTTASHSQEQQQQPSASLHNSVTASQWHLPAPQLPSTALLRPEHVLFLKQQLNLLPSTSCQAPLPEDDQHHPSAQHHWQPPLPPSSPPPLPTSSPPPLPPDCDPQPPLPADDEHRPPLPTTEQQPPLPSPPKDSSPTPSRVRHQQQHWHLSRRS